MNTINDLSFVTADKVSLTDSYLANALSKEVSYLLSFDSDRWLAGFRETAGLDTLGKERYPGWEEMLIAGHAFGHFIGACSYAYLSPDITKEQKDALYKNLTYIVDNLKICQDNSKAKPGFLFCGKILDKNNLELQFDNVEIGKTHLITEAWVPWYTVHKILQGVIDVYNNTGYEVALQVAKGIGDWTYNRASAWGKELNLKVLQTEYGGMNDCLYELYAITKDAKYAEAAHFFDEEALFERVLAGSKDVLNNHHANTTIPKFVGALKRYYYLHDEKYLDYCKAFFKMVRDKHTYITGGNSEWEHFGEDSVLDKERTNANNETCNTHNMLKLSKLLFMITGDVEYADFYENTFINAILSSQNPKTGMTMYFQPMATGYFKTFSEPYTKFWCCTGTGMENFSRLADGMYFTKGSDIIVNIYMSSTFTAKNFTLAQCSDIFDGGNTTFKISSVKESTKSTIYFRVPDWCQAPMTVTLNGQACEYDFIPGYLAVTREFKDGDEITLTIPMALTAHPLPDNKASIGFKYGPLVLSAGLGREDMVTTTTGVDVTIPKDKKVDSEIIKLNGISLDEFTKNPSVLFEQKGCSPVFKLKSGKLVFTPHFSKYDERYGIYWYFE